MDSPCALSEKNILSGSKKDVWFAIDPTTGEKIETLSQDAADKVCPASHERAVFIGRTEYQLTMFDSRNRLKKWNGTFTDYSSHVLPGTTVERVQVDSQSTQTQCGATSHNRSTHNQRKRSAVRQAISHRNLWHVTGHGVARGGPRQFGLHPKPWAPSPQECSCGLCPQTPAGAPLHTPS